MSLINKKKKKDKFDVLFCYGDRHVPFQDVTLERIILEMIDDLKPDIVLDGGDMISADCLSTFPKAYMQLAGLQAELDEDFSWRSRINDIAPKATKIVLRDNHFFRRLEDRIKDQIWMEDLRSIQGEELLRLKELGWKLVHEWKWRNKIVFMHGDDKSTGMTAASARNPVNKVRNLNRDYALSVVRFHTHVTGFEMYRRQNNTTFALQLGTFQDVAKTEYLKHRDFVNWTNSAAVIYLSTKTDEFHVVPILFNGKSAFLNGKYYY